MNAGNLIVTPVDMDRKIRYIISPSRLFVPINCTVDMLTEIIEELRRRKTNDKAN
jgi:hypothetical protein